MRTILAVLLALAAGSVQPSAAAAQNVILDEGTFQLTLNGAPYGTETFSIRRAGTGVDTRIIARAEVQISHQGARKSMVAALQASGGEMALAAYQIKVSGDEQRDVAVQLSGRRFVATVKSEDGERVQEFRAAANTALIDDEVAHHFHFVMGKVGAGSVPVAVIMPRLGRQLQMTLTSVGTDRVEVGGQVSQARHVRIEGGGQTRDVWFDDAGRVLAVENPATGYRAVRLERPA